MVFEQEHLIRSQDADDAGVLRPDALFFLMQEAAGEHSTLLGCGRERLLRDKGIVWMLLRVQLEMQRYPRVGESLGLRTWPGLTSRTAYPRYFEFFRADGQRIGCASTLWVLVDLKTRRLVLPKAADIGLTGDGAQTPPMAEIQHFRADVEGGIEKARSVCYADLDENGHVNNTRYIAWLAEAAPKPSSNAFLSELNVHYAAEILPSQRVAIRVKSQEEGRFAAQCLVENTLAFEAQGKWAPWAEGEDQW